MTEKSVFIQEVESHQKRYSRLIRFTHSSTISAGIMLAAAVLALLIANSSFSGFFFEALELPISLSAGSLVGSMSIAEIIDEIFMAIFFLMVGLEIKYEMTVGELTNIRQALLPIGAAVGGVCIPIVIYSFFNAGNPLTHHGWGVPTATDIAFALGILALLGDRVPNGVRVFLSTLAVADDIIAILIIAIFYGQTPSLFWLGCAAVVLLVLVMMNRTHIFSLTPYLLVGAVLWYCVFRSGVHATISGVLLAFTIPSGSRVNLRTFSKWSREQLSKARDSFDPDQHVMGQEDYLKAVGSLSNVSRQVIPPATRLEKKLYPWVNFAILPLFALTNADVCFVGSDVGAMLSNPALFGVFFGLLLGKPIGIMLASFILVKTKLVTLPENVNWMHMLGAGILGGVGFTMAIFVANLSFTDPDLIACAKLGILSASLLAGVLGFAFLAIQARRAHHAGVSFIAIGNVNDVNRQTRDAEAMASVQSLVDELSASSAADDLAIAQLQTDGAFDEIVYVHGSKDSTSDSRRIAAVMGEKEDTIDTVKVVTPEQAAEMGHAAAAVIMAAGAGTRMKSDKPKVVHQICDKPLVRWVVDAVHAAGIDRVVTVVGHKREMVEPLVPDTDIAFQEKQCGTANAVLSAKEALRDFEGSVVVVSGDSPLITPETLQRLIAVREQNDAAAVVLTMELDNPFGYGRILRNEAGDFVRIVEDRDANEEERAIRECNSGFYCFDAKVLFDALTQVGTDNSQGEYYLTDVLTISQAAGRPVMAMPATSPDECLGVNTPEQLSTAEAVMRSRLRQKALKH